MEWLKVTVTTTSECADIVSLILLDAGSEGVSVADKEDVKRVLESKDSWDYADESLTDLSDERVFVSGFFPSDFSVENMESALARFKTTSVFPTGSLETALSTVKDADWENEWKKYYEPIEIENVAIVPKWLKYDGRCPVRVLIDPGMAFGTGRHETTAMCIKLLQHTEIKGKRTLDVGCGSGILGITALKLGAKHCVMTDIDRKAVESARENAILNGAENGASFTCGDLDCAGGKFDVVTANITADILLLLQEKLVEVLKTGGAVVLSGLIHSRADEVIAAYERDFKVKERLSEGEWQAMLLEKK